MKKTETGLQRPLYPKNNMKYDYMLLKITALKHYGSRCHKDLLCDHTVLHG